MATGIADLLEDSKRKLLGSLAGGADVTFLRPHGNVGDHLIHAGTRQLLSRMRYREAAMRDFERVGGHTAVLGGSGGWCGPYHDLPAYLPRIEGRFERVVIFPSSFDVSVSSVKEALGKTRALVFAREEVSYRQIRELCRADLALDGAFFFDYAPYKRPGQGILTAFRTDREAAGEDVPPGNIDVSRTCESLDEWLWTIAQHAAVRTDRAHVTIAAALLGKEVEYRSSTYHKVPAIVDYALRGFPVRRLTESPRDGTSTAAFSTTPPPNQHLLWAESLRLAGQELADLLPQGGTVLFVDDNKIGPLPMSAALVPFLQRNGEYWGAPEDDATAIREFEILHRKGAAFIAFAWPAFWWLDHYAGFHQCLRSRFRCVLQNDRLVVFDLRTDAVTGNAEAQR